MENALLKTILNEYLTAHPQANADTLSAFCAYADNWLVESNIVGVGMTADGVSLRLGNGTETCLFVATASPEILATSVCVTGTDVIAPAATDSRIA